MFRRVLIIMLMRSFPRVNRELDWHLKSVAFNTKTRMIKKIKEVYVRRKNEKNLSISNND